ncbi:hypothetical protein ACHAXN_004290 [Cyclotella atomus]
MSFTLFLTLCSKKKPTSSSSYQLIAYLLITIFQHAQSIQSRGKIIWSLRKEIGHAAIISQDFCIRARSTSEPRALLHIPSGNGLGVFTTFRKEYVAVPSNNRPQHISLENTQRILHQQHGWTLAVKCPFKSRAPPTGASIQEPSTDLADGFSLDGNTLNSRNAADVNKVMGHLLEYCFVGVRVHPVTALAEPISQIGSEDLSLSFFTERFPRQDNAIHDSSGIWLGHELL